MFFVAVSYPNNVLRFYDVSQLYIYLFQYVQRRHSMMQGQYKCGNILGQYFKPLNLLAT